MFFTTVLIHFLSFSDETQDDQTGGSASGTLGRGGIARGWRTNLTSAAAAGGGGSNRSKDSDLAYVSTSAMLKSRASATSLTREVRVRKKFLHV